MCSFSLIRLEHIANHGKIAFEFSKIRRLFFSPTYEFTVISTVVYDKVLTNNSCIGSINPTFMKNMFTSIYGD